MIATQNPLEQAGTYPLPESQLDRFLMRIQLGYPPPKAERDLLKGTDRRKLINDLKVSITPEKLLEFQNECEGTVTSDALLDYLMRLITYTRESMSSIPGCPQEAD